MQLPEAHRDPEVHGDPLATTPQEPLTQGCPTQSPSLAQVVEQAVPPALHLNGAHVTVGAGLQVPAPSQDDPLTAALPEELHDPPPQLVALGHNSQWPLPSQWPSCWQVDAAATWQAVWVGEGSCPRVTGEHAPTSPGKLHCMQLSVHASSQQTPSAQKVDAHDAPLVQLAPIPRLIGGVAASAPGVIPLASSFGAASGWPIVAGVVASRATPPSVDVSDGNDGRQPATPARSTPARSASWPMCATKERRSPRNHFIYHVPSTRTSSRPALSQTCACPDCADSGARRPAMTTTPPAARPTAPAIVPMSPTVQPVLAES